MKKIETIFERYEIKYKITETEKTQILATLAPYMRLDQYGRTAIRNLYLDTDDFRMIRRSIEKPIYKEKLRLRCYEQVTAERNVFVELKKKYQSVVYKRRLALAEGEIMDALQRGLPLPVRSQIGEEIEYVRQFYGNLKPRVFLSYEREAYYAIDGTDLRITFDDNVLYRRNDLSLTKPPYGTSILEQGYILMEIKTSRAIPLWLTEILTKLKIFKTSFSKYGTAYADMMKQGNKGEQYYAEVI